jgi:hypothetical protein
MLRYNHAMQIRARLSISADGYITTPSGWPAMTVDPAAAAVPAREAGWSPASQARE